MEMQNKSKGLIGWGGWIWLHACAPAETRDFGEEKRDGGWETESVNVLMLAKEREGTCERKSKRDCVE